MNNCNLTCPKLPDLMLAQSFLGLEVTYESMVCGQIGLKHCKVWPGQRKMELVRVNTNVTGKKMAYKLDVGHNHNNPNFHFLIQINM